MKNFKMVLQYDGSRYDGWQKQGNTGNTIQEKIETVLERMMGDAVELIGSGRTDAGVHALGQVANVHLETDMTPEKIKNYLNDYLPEDIAVIQLEIVPERFHSRLNATGKLYTYSIETGRKKQVFQRKYMYGLGKSLNVKAMEQAAKYFLGTHDFRSFCSNKKVKKSTVRTIKTLNIRERGSQLEISISGDGFLYNMVRIMIGTLIEVGLGKRTPESINEILEAKKRQEAGDTAPAEGLKLTAVFYEEQLGE